MAINDTISSAKIVDQFDNKESTRRRRQVLSKSKVVEHVRLIHICQTYSTPHTVISKL